MRIQAILPKAEEVNLKPKDRELTVEINCQPKGYRQITFLGSKEVENFKPWTWICYSDYNYFGDSFDTYYYLLYGGIQEKGTYHNVCFPVIFDFHDKAGNTFISLSDDPDDWYCPGSLEDWDNQIKQDPTGFFGGLRLVTDYERKVCETIMKSNGLFIQKSLGKVSGREGKELKEIRYPSGILMFCDND